MLLYDFANNAVNPCRIGFLVKGKNGFRQRAIIEYIQQANNCRRIYDGAYLQHKEMQLFHIFYQLSLKLLNCWSDHAGATHATSIQEPLVVFNTNLEYSKLFASNSNHNEKIAITKNLNKWSRVIRQLPVVSRRWMKTDQFSCFSKPWFRTLHRSSHHNAD